jgi:dipeptidyl-peptidase-4
MKIDTGAEADQYISRIGWTPRGELFFYRQNRLQNHFEVLVAGSDGAASVLYEELDERYIERPDGRTVTFLEDGRFIVHSERDGGAHLYLADRKGGTLKPITNGEWEVRQIVDVVGDRVYYLSNEGSPLRNNLWSMRLDGRAKRRLTDGEGIYTIAPSRWFKYFISYFSNAGTPNLVRLHDGSGRVVRTLEDNAALQLAIAEYKLPRKEFFTFETSSGVALNGWMLKPNDFDAAKKYPVLMFQYSGPGSQEVLDEWAMDWYDVLVQKD